jgi:signal transduction histidine kinase
VIQDGAEVENEELEIVAEGGIRRRLLRSARTMREPDGTVSGGVVTLMDITPQKTVEDELRRLAQANFEAVGLRDEVLAMVSHDLRNPLQTILMASDVLMREGRDVQDGGSPLRLVQKVKRAAERMNAMIEDILDLARLESGSFRVGEKSNCDGTAVEEAVEIMRPFAEEKEISLTTEIHSGFLVECDKEQILRVFANLLRNALKFTPRGGKVRVLVEKGVSAVRFSVLDTGPGIEREKLPLVFQRFWMDKEKTNAGSGLGLGLTIAKGIVEIHGGRIWVESEEGKGAAFRFTLPIKHG